MFEQFWALLLALGIPAAMTGFIIRRFEKRLDERDKKRDLEQQERERKAEERERNREKMNQLQLQSIMASLCLGEATAKAVQRIPDAHCNGDMTKALEKVENVRASQREFLTNLGMHYLYDDNC